MKKHVISILAVLTIGLSFVIANPSGKGRPVKITKECIQIPGTEISQRHQDKVKAILEKYDGKLYKIQPYSNGKPQQPIGQMKIDAATAAEVAKYAKSTGLTAWTTQIGLCVGMKCSMGGPACVKQAHASDELVEEVTKILKKYQ
jgi:hypothetical protein